MGHGSALRIAERAGLHSGADRGPHRILGHSEASQDFALSLRGSAAMAAHRGNDEWFAAAGSNRVDSSRQEFDKTANSAASRGDRNALPRLNLPPQARGRDP